MQSTYQPAYTGAIPINLLSNLHPPGSIPPMGKLLPQDQIQAIENALKEEKEDARYTKKYLTEELGITINRGGVIRLQNRVTQEYELYATFKIPGTRTDYVVGEGGMGVTMLLQNLKTGEFAVLKKPLIRDKNQVEPIKKLFRKEARVNKLVGQSVTDRLISKVTLDDQGNKQYENGAIFFIQKYIPGVDLEKLFRKDNIKLTLEQRFDIAIQAIEETQKLHALNYIHRDITPKNIMYDQATGKVTLFDYGCATDITKPINDIMGTPGFMPAKTTERNFDGTYNHNTYTDVYALASFFQEIFSIKESGSILLAFKEEEYTLGYLDTNFKLPDNSLLHQELFKLITEMKAEMETKRPGLNEIKQSLIKMKEKLIDYQNDITIKQAQLEAEQKAKQAQLEAEQKAIIEQEEKRVTHVIEELKSLMDRYERNPSAETLKRFKETTDWLSTDQLKQIYHLQSKNKGPFLLQYIIKSNENNPEFKLNFDKNIIKLMKMKPDSDFGLPNLFHQLIAESDPDGIKQLMQENSYSIQSLLNQYKGSMVSSQNFGKNKFFFSNSLQPIELVLLKKLQISMSPLNTHFNKSIDTLYSSIIENLYQNLKYKPDILKLLDDVTEDSFVGILSKHPQLLKDKSITPQDFSQKKLSKLAQIKHFTSNPEKAILEKPNKDFIKFLVLAVENADQSTANKWLKDVGNVLGELLKIKNPTHGNRMDIDKLNFLMCKLHIIFSDKPQANALNYFNAISNPASLDAAENLFLGINFVNDINTNKKAKVHLAHAAHEQKNQQAIEILNAMQQPAEIKNTSSNQIHLETKFDSNTSSARQSLSLFRKRANSELNEANIQAVIISIQYYLKTKPKTENYVRANKYLTLLESSKSNLESQIYIYALIQNPKDKELVKQVLKTMHYQNEQIGKLNVETILEPRLQEKGTNINEINNFYVNKITEKANSKEPFLDVFTDMQDKLREKISQNARKTLTKQ